MEIDIRKIVVMITNATDQIYLYTSFPSPYPPEVCTNPLTLTFESTKGRGESYVRENFPGIPFEVLDVSTSGRKSLLVP